MKQKMQIIGVSRRQGVSKKTGNQYDIAVVNTLQPQIGVDSNYMASGFKSVEMQAPAPIVMQSLQLAFPCEVEAELAIRGDGKLEILSMTPVKAATLTPAKAS